MNHARLHSPLGDILLHFDDDALWGLYFDGQKHQPAAIAQLLDGIERVVC